MINHTHSKKLDLTFFAVRKKQAGCASILLVVVAVLVGPFLVPVPAPEGLTVQELADGLTMHPAEGFEGDDCGRILENTTHFHIDPLGNLYTGHCPGISVATVDDLHPTIDTSKNPVYCQLAEGGPVWLWRGLAPDFEPDAKGYISKCHLCLEVRKHLRATGHYDELRPDEYYRE